MISLKNWIGTATERVNRYGKSIEADQAATQEFFPAGTDELAFLKYIHSASYKSAVGYEVNTSTDFFDLYSESAIPEHDIFLQFTPTRYYFDISYIDRSDNTDWHYTLERPLDDMRKEDYIIAKFCLVDFVREFDPVRTD